jgi:hypothetical protein
MNMVIGFLLIYYTLLHSVGLCERQLPDYLYVNKRTDLIYQRFYFIKRLQRAIDVLHNNTLQHMHFEQLEPLAFQSCVIRDAVLQMKRAKSVNALDDLWHAFVSYQHLYDPLFAEEYISLICMIYMMQKSHIKTLRSTSIESLLSYLDSCLDDYNNYSYYDERKRFIEDTIATDHVARRYFIIKRLQKVVHFVNGCYKDLFSLNTGISKQTIDRDIKYFQHTRIKEAFVRVSHDQTFEPLLEVWRECLQYRYVSDDLFIKELIKGFLLFYKIFLLQYNFKKVDEQISSAMDHVLDLYENIDKLPLDETLDALDVTTEALTAIQTVQETEQQKNMVLFLPVIFLLGLLIVNSLCHVASY